jgi:hypothetical protein
MTQVVEHKALRSILSTTKTSKQLHKVQMKGVN